MPQDNKDLNIWAMDASVTDPERPAMIEIEAAKHAIITTPLLADVRDEVPEIMKNTHSHHADGTGDDVNVFAIAPLIENSIIVNITIIAPNTRISERRYT